VSTSAFLPPVEPAGHSIGRQSGPDAVHVGEESISVANLRRPTRWVAPVVPSTVTRRGATGRYSKRMRLPLASMVSWSSH
jgi:hypothetical protein